MKPLMRWSIGPVRPEGFAVLRSSVKSARKLFPEFDFAICYNQITDAQIEQLKRLEVTLVNGNLHTGDFIFPPKLGYNVYWKLYPPRLRIAAPEIFLDNDLIFTKRPQEIDLFLAGNSTLLYQGLNADLHGCFTAAIPEGMRINSGLFGMPAGFDLKQRAADIAQEYKITSWNGGFDEQGLVAATLLRHPRYYIVPLTVIPIIEPTWSIEKFTTPLCCGYHFVKVNYQKHETWNKSIYRKTESSQIKFL